MTTPGLPCVQPPAGMAAWWSLDETSGTTAFDIADFPTNGTHVPNGPTPVLGKVAGGLSTSTASRLCRSGRPFFARLRHGGSDP